jgi:3-phenylpropionate/trans-cinnamate dioxygenase ferredoxin reductase subunit
MNEHESTIVIVRAGPAGGRTAQALREAGCAGTIRLLGAERHLPYERPPLSKGVLTGEATINSLSNRRRALAIRARLVAGTRLTVIGGGVIGLEVGASARRLGAEVVVIEAADRLLGRVAPPAIGAWMAQLHRENGVELMPGESVDTVVPHGAGAVLQTGSGRRVEADLVVAGVGMVPNVEAAGASPMAADGIIVDQSGRSADPGIFAVGDVRACHVGFGTHLRLESWRNAELQGRAVAAAIMGQPLPPPPPIPWMWTDQYDANLQVAGIVPADGAEWVVRKFTLLGLVGQRVVAGCTVNQGRAMRSLIAGGRTADAERLSDMNEPLSAIASATAA